MGIQYYKNLIKELRDNNIEPLPTIFHWDLPIMLEREGGYWSESFSDWFANFARICFKEFGDSITYWATFNEAYVFCGTNLNDSAIRDYRCVHNVLKAHAKAYRVYEKEFKLTQKGNVFHIYYSHNIGRYKFLIFVWFLLAKFDI